MNQRQRLKKWRKWQKRHPDKAERLFRAALRQTFSSFSAAYAYHSEEPLFQVAKTSVFVGQPVLVNFTLSGAEVTERWGEITVAEVEVEASKPHIAGVLYDE